LELEENRHAIYLHHAGCDTMKYPHFKPSEELHKELKTLRHSSHAVWNLNYHLVWIPKYRKPVLAHPKVKEICESILRGQAECRDWKPLALEIQPDHIHYFVSVPPTWTVSEVVGILKGNSSIQLRRVFPYLKAQVRKSLWAEGYYASTAGFISQAQVKKYIEQQSRHLNIRIEPTLDKATKESLDKILTDFTQASLPPKPKGMGIREAI